MTTLIVLFNLNEGQSEADYEKWAVEQDIPTAGTLNAVQNFNVYRAESIFGSEDKPPYRYIEIIDITSPEALGADVGASDKMADISKAFREFADNPTFMVTEKFG
ncbi:MAG TPA: REDY-like protein HapK [Sneathiellales bacterium]|jgi:hypothetical protein|nr:REDY-like protein HapK [Sneathiellales bacterium]